MGYECHDYVVVHYSDYADKDKSYIGFIDKIKKDIAIDGYNQEIIHHFSGINGRNTVVFLPDGSKKGWKASDYYQEKRELFLSISKKLEFAEILQVSGFLDHSGVNCIVDIGDETFDCDIGDY